MKPGFVQTGDLVRFHVICSIEAGAELYALQDAEIAAGRPWFTEHSIPTGVIRRRAFTCSKAVAPLVLDILARHGVERRETLE